MDNVCACKISRKQVEVINDSINTIGAISKHPVRRSNIVDCQASGKTYIKGQCLTHNKFCNECKKKNHFAAVSKSTF